MILLGVIVLFLPKYANFLQKNAGIRKIKGFLVLKVYFLKLHMCLYLRTNIQVSSIIPTAKITP